MLWNLARKISFRIVAMLFLVCLFATSGVQLAHASTTATYNWAKIFAVAPGTYLYPYDVAADYQGNTFVTGMFDGTVTFDGVGGSDTRESGPDGNIFLTKYSQNGSYNWTKTFDTSEGEAEGYSVATDATGNVYVTGYYEGTVTFDGTEGADTKTGSDCGSVFTTKYSGSGDYGWTKVIDTPGPDEHSNCLYLEADGIAADSNGGIYIAGSFTGSITFDGPGGSDTINGGSASDSFLTKYTSNGNYGWTKAFDVDNSVDTYASTNSVSTDTNGKVYVTGVFNGPVTFDGVDGDDTISATTESAFLTQYSADGTYGWTNTVSPSEGHQVNSFSVAAGSDGNVYITGDFTGTVTFDDPGGSHTVNTGNFRSSYLSKYSADGTYGWTKTLDILAISELNGDGYAQQSSVAVDSIGGVYITGYFEGTIAFDGPGGSDIRSSANDNAFLVRYSNSGTYDWTKTFDVDSSPGSVAYPLSVATDPQNNAYLTGYFNGTVDFSGLGDGSGALSYLENFDTFLTSFNVLGDNTGNNDGNNPGHNQTPTPGNNNLAKLSRSGAGNSLTTEENNTTPQTDNNPSNSQSTNQNQSVGQTTAKNKGSSLYKWLIAGVVIFMLIFLIAIISRRRKAQNTQP